MAEKKLLEENEYAIGNGAEITFQGVLPDFTVDSSGILTITLKYKIEESKFQINLGSDPVGIEVGDCGVFKINDAHITKAIEFVAENFTLNALASGPILMQGSSGMLETDGDKGRQGS